MTAASASLAVPATELTPPSDDRALITLIGAGFTGTSIAVQQIGLYLAAYRDADGAVPPLTLRLIDKSGQVGPGLPYATADDIFLLNQPVWAMSPFADDPGHFARWRAARGYGSDENAFERRSVYGRYLKDIFAEAVRDARNAGADITIQTVKGRVDALSFETGGAIALNGAIDAPDAQASDAVIVADGHQKSSLLQELRDDEFYFEPPFSVASVRERLNGKTGTVVIVGTSQSMLDALAVLDHIGWQGTVRAVSRDLILPWPFYPEHYGQDSGYAPYIPSALTPAQIAGAALAGENPSVLAQRELDSADTRGYDTGHVVTCTAVYDAIAAAETDPACTAYCTALRDHLAKVYGNPTPPERYALFRRWLDDGRLELARDAIGPGIIERATNDNAAYTLHAETGDVSLAAIFNGACFTRDALASPVLRQAHEDGALRWNAEKSQPEAGRQAHPGLFVDGPAAHRDKWGVETFRDECRDTARESLAHALARHTALAYAPRLT